MAEKPQKQPDEPETPKQRTCGAMVVHERLLRTNPAYVRARVASENFHHQFLSRGAAARSGVTVIPVVVHVVYNTPAQNISDAQIQSQIDVLNRDYRKTNADIGSIPAAFQALATDARIEFELASKDPTGAATNGITRTQTNTVTFTDDDKVKATATGGHDAWPADTYLNLWVCPLGGGLLGYAQFPGGPAATDGVVILHSGFGTSGTATAPFNLGRTATHEIGHWLNLRHIWGDDGNGCNGSDFVNDTPNQGGPNYGVPAFPHVTCNNGPNGDLFMDYMDYVDDAAMFMFTQGQVDRMQACLDGDRSAIGHVKAIPSVKFVEDHPTLKFRDDQPPTLKFRDDQPPTLKFRDDQPPTLKFNDDQPPTLKFNEDQPPTLKFRDDRPPTLKFRDDQPPTLKFRDDISTKTPQSDMTKGPGSDAGFPQWQEPGPTRAAPFVLATPHHSMAWTQSFPDAARAALQEVQYQLQQYEQLLEEYSQADAAQQLSPQDRQQAEALYAEYEALGREYQQLIGQG